MKLHLLRRGSVAVLAVAALSTGLAACGSDDKASGPKTSGAPTTASTTSSGTDLAAQVFGKACGNLPISGDGSLDAMVVDPVAVAAGTSSHLKTLTSAIGAIKGLSDKLDSAPALTVFAPDDAAFEAMPKAMLSSLVAGGKKKGTKSPLYTILAHHVLSGQDDPTALVGKQTTLAGDTLTVEGDATQGMTVSDGTVTAHVLCGNIQTSNAKVYVIDKVLTGVKN